MSNPVFNGNYPPGQFVLVTPSDTAVLTGVQWLRVGAAGNLALQSLAGGTPVVIAVTAGEYLPFGYGYVMNTNTTATGIVAFS